jgi:TonB family protein
MIATWMLYASLVGLFASLAAHALDRAARVSRMPSRFVWLVAMIATVLAPIAGYAARRAIRNTPHAAVTPGGMTSLGPVDGARSAPSSFSAVVGALRAASARADRPVAIIWAAFSVLLFGRLAFATGMVWRNRRTWTPREINGVPLFVTPDLGPAVVALPRSEILVPEWLLSLDDTHVAMVVRHEREHRAAGDPRLLVVASVLTALVPWNPALWWQRRRLRLAVEMDCDARVLRADPRVDRYGSLLLAIAQHPRVAVYGAATLTESTSDLERRIDAMTRKPSPAPRITAATLATFALAAVLAACMTPAPDVIAAPSSNPIAGIGAAPLSDFRLEVPARVDTGNLPVRYPEQLRSAGIGGVVVAKFVVDTNGRAEMRTLEIVKSDHDLFTNAVRQSLLQMRFVPARLGGRRVRQLMEMPFMFADPLAAKRGMMEVPAGRVALSAMRTPHEVAATSRAVVSAGKVPQVAYDEVAVSARPPSDTAPPVANADNQPPKYPVQLRIANIEGRVVARFVVRANGEVDTTTFVIVSSSHDLFSNSVREGVKTLHFSPATVKGNPVDWLVTMPFVFSLSK